MQNVINGRDRNFVNLVSVMALVIGLGTFGVRQVNAEHPGGAPSATVSPNTAGLVAELTFTFDVNAHVPPNIGEFEIIFDKDSIIPTNISRHAVLVSATKVTNCSGGTAPCDTSTSPNIGPGGQSVPLAFDPVFDTDPNDARRVVMRMRIPDMDPLLSNPGIGAQGIAAGATVTVTLTPAAGFRNSEEADSQRMNIRMSAQPGGSNLIPGNTRVGARSEMKIFTSHPFRRRGSTLTVIGRGFKTDVSATVWLDNGVDLDGDGVIETAALSVVNETISGIDINGDGDATDTAVTFFGEFNLGFDINGDGDSGDTVPVLRETDFRNNGKRDAGERDLGNVIVGADGTFTAAFTVQNPPFSPILLDENLDVVDLNRDGDTVDDEIPINVINAIDGEGSVPAPQYTRTVELQPRLIVTPKQAGVGDIITLILKDFLPGSQLQEVSISGINVSLVSVPTSFDANGELTTNVRIPPGIPPGVQTVFAITNNDQDHDDTITILGATLSTSHRQIVSNQNLTVNGSGFSKGGGVCIPAGKITLSNVPLQISANSTSSACGSTGVQVNNSGAFVATVLIRATGANPFPSALLTAGNHELRVVDSNGVVGIINVTMKPRMVRFQPLSSSPGNNLTVIGSGYPANNPAGSSPSVTITYDCGASCSTQTTADPDSSGNFHKTLQIPSNAPIPSRNAVITNIAGTSVADTFVHGVSAGLLTLTPPSGEVGDTIAVEGCNFRSSTAVEVLQVGGIGVLGGGATTDADGCFTVNIVIPGNLTIGLHPVTAIVGTGNLEVTAVGTFEVTDVQSAVGAALGPLGANLIRVWGQDALAPSGWRVYDPDVPELSDLTALVRGRAYWFKVAHGETVTLGGNEYVFSAGWTLITWQ